MEHLAQLGISDLTEPVHLGQSCRIMAYIHFSLSEQDQLSANLSLVHDHIIVGVDLGSLDLGQLSVAYAMLHFGR
jgi:hypothetical protein